MQLVLGGIKVWLFFLVLGVTPGLGHREVLQTTSLRRSNGGYLLSRDDAANSAQGAGMKYEAEEKEPKKKPEKEEGMSRSTTCGVMLGALVFLCCCGEILTRFIGGLAKMLPAVCTIGVLVYLLATGTFQRWLYGEKVNTYCMILCIWALVVAPGSCCVVLFVTAGIGAKMKADEIKNKTVKEIRLEFDRLEGNLSEEKKAYFTSPEFKTKCDELFDQADLDKNGTLSMEELKGSALQSVKGIDEMQQDPYFVSAFDQNKNDEIEKDEFAEMMKYFEMKYGDGKA